MRLRALAMGVVLLAVWWVGGVESEEAKPFATPQEAFDAAAASAKKGDWKAFHACLTKASGDDLTGQLASFGLVVRALAANDKAGKIKKHLPRLEEVYERHDLPAGVLKKLQEEKDKAERQRRLVGRIREQGAFCDELMKVLQDISPRAEVSPFEGSALREVKVDGDRAAGVMVSETGGKERREKVAFARMDGGWRVELPKPAAGKK